jgi:cytochrome b
MTGQARLQPPIAPYDAPSRLIHLLLALAGLSAVVSGQFAGDYKLLSHPGFDVHEWAGLAMAAAVAVRLAWGVAGPASMRFARWLPVTSARLRVVGDDVVQMLRLRLPEHEDGHAGIAGLVQSIGLAAFAWMAVTGAVLFLWLEPGARASGWLRAVKELHEGGQAVLLGYLALHVGAVLAHALAGRPLWRRMFSLHGGRP